MSSLMPVAKQKYWDNNGDPLIGGKVHFYGANSTTPQTTWSDQEKTQTNPNPVILDNRGEAFVFGEGRYAVKVTDSNDNLIWEKNNVSSLASSADLASEEEGQGSNLITHLPNYADLSPRSLSDVANGLTITPFHFHPGGPLPEDCSALLEKAIKFVFGTFSNPRILDLCGRNWQVKAPIVYSSKPVAASVIQNGRISAQAEFPVDRPIFDFQQASEGPASTGTSFRLFNVAFNGGGPSAGQEYAAGAIWLKNTHGVYIDFCAFQNFGSHAVWDKTTREATEVVISNGRFLGRGRKGDAIYISGDDSEIHNCVIRGHSNGITLLSGSTGVLGNHIYGCDNAIVDSGGNTIIANNYIDNCPIRLRALNVTNIINGNKFLGTSTADYPERGFIVAEPQTASAILDDLLITDNAFINPGADLTTTAINSADGAIAEVRRLRMVDNVASGIQPQSSHISVSVSINASSGTLISADLSSYAAFGFPIKVAKAAFERGRTGTSFPILAALAPTSSVVEIALSELATGKVHIDASVSSSFS